MTPTRQGSFRLFRFAGVDVFLHWSWFLVAVYEINSRTREYSSPIWNALEYVALFVIVLLHEFGHSLACRQVGGQADQIVLWPLGGVAYVSPPQRPGATLWSIAAGPLVNVALAPVLTVVVVLGAAWGWTEAIPDAYKLLQAVCIMNFMLLFLNLLPIYPLDGGQILRSLLWFGLGRARSLLVATIVGFVGVAGLIVAALLMKSAWIGVLAVFILLNCWGGLMQARLLAKLAQMPRRDGYACPACKQPPIIGAFWRCDKCRKAFDTFDTHAVCPQCGNQFAVTRCPDCGAAHPITEWMAGPPLAFPPRM
jgi:Zn-dependent protease/predicted RNA-binding Zn-ribbon protein involved in translation (DUF1610 family)